MLLLIDNYDSFTYNLYQYLAELGADVCVVRNDRISVEDVDRMEPDRVVISPGPGTPEDAGASVSLIRHFGARQVPVLGVCLGHQCIGVAFGGIVEGAGEIFHGKSSEIHHGGRGVLSGLPSPLQAIRYHSLAVRRDDLPSELEVTAWTENDIIMGLRHRSLPVEGVQFHPESIMTADGKHILRNFLERGGQ